MFVFKIYVFIICFLYFFFFRYDALLLVDSVAIVGGAPLFMDAWSMVFPHFLDLKKKKKLTIIVKTYRRMDIIERKNCTVENSKFELYRNGLNL